MGNVIAEYSDYALAYQFIGDSFRESLGEGQRYTDDRVRLIEREGQLTPRALSEKDCVTTASISQWLKPMIEKGVFSWCDEKGHGFLDVAELEKAKRSGKAYLKVVGGRFLPTVFELTGDPRWNKDGELYSAYDLQLDGDPIEKAFYPDEETVVDQDIIFDDEHAPEKGKAAVKVLSEKSHSEVLKMVDDFRKSEQAEYSIDAANINLGKKFSELLSPDGYGMVN